MRVLIAGCGYVGSAAARQLAADGHRVFGLRRSGGPVPDGIVPVRADVTDPDTLGDLPADLDRVVYAVSPDGRTPEGYRRAWVDGPQNLLDALAATSPDLSRFLLVSSTGVYDEADGRWVDEETPPGSAGPSAEALLEGEGRLADAGVPSVILRLGGIYGPGRTSLVERVRTGRTDCPGAGRFTNRIHRDDAARAIRTLLGLEKPRPLYLGVDREPAPLRAVLRWIARRLGLGDPCPRSAAGDDTGRRGTNKRCSSDRLVAEGFTFCYPTYREGYAALMESG